MFHFHPVARSELVAIRERAIRILLNKLAPSQQSQEKIGGEGKMSRARGEDRAREDIRHSTRRSAKPVSYSRRGRRHPIHSGYIIWQAVAVEVNQPARIWRRSVSAAGVGGGGAGRRRSGRPRVADGGGDRGSPVVFSNG
jgi:hypothetical protein